MSCGASVLVFLVFCGLAVGLGVLARRLTKVAQQVRAVERENAALQGRLDRLERSGRSEPPAPAEPLEEVPSPSLPPVQITPSPSPPAASAATVSPPASRRREESPPAEPPSPPAEPPSPPPEPAEPPPAPLWQRIEWERWIGVRGAAVVGAAVLGLAGLLFLKYSIEQGLVPPIVRVIAGVLTGLGCVVASEALRRRKRDYTFTANGLAGAGVVILYAAVWAAQVLYGLIGSGAGFLLMIFITVACGALAWRHASSIIAVLGLVGGFATPALLSSGSDRPLSLFGYLLLLNIGVLVLSLRQGWSLPALLSLGFTTLYQIVWIFGAMGGERTLLGLVILAVFSVLYVGAAQRARGGVGEDEGQRSWRLAQATAVLVPMLVTFYFAGNADLGEHLYPLAGLLLLLSLLAQWIARRQGTPLYGTAAAAATVAAVAVWCLRTDFRPALTWEAVLCGALLTLAFHLPWEFLGRGAKIGGEAVAALGFLGLFVLTPLAAHTPPEGPSPWPWMVAWLFLGVLLWRLAADDRGEFLPLLGSLLVALGSAGFYLEHHPGEAAPMLLFALAAGVACQGAALRLRRVGRRWPEVAAAALPLLLLFLLLPEMLEPALPVWSSHGVTLGAAALVVLAATRLASVGSVSGGLLLGALGMTVLGHTLWSFHFYRDGEALAGFLAQGVAVVGFTAWPFLAQRAFRDDRWAWYAAALAGPAWFLSLRHLFETLWGNRFIGILPLVLGALGLAAATSIRQSRSPKKQQHSRLVWFAAVALGFVSLAIPLQLDKEWVTLGWALQGAAMLALWRRLDHPGLKWFSLALLGATTVRLVANPAVLGYYSHGGWPVLNWLLYTYLVPAAALVVSARLLAGMEVERQRPWEAGLYRHGWSVTAGACGAAAIAVIFVWINLTIFEAFSSGRVLVVSLDRLPARDLALSLAWVVYALLLLALGMARGVRTLRWLSLGFLILTLLKVFLYDLGELEDLYRVASLVGLALSLLAVSLAYQRFVFGRRDEKEVDP